jgi:hypothetical protein
MHPPYSPVGLHDLPVLDLRFSSQKTLWNLKGPPLYLKHRPPQLLGAGLTTTRDLPLSLCVKTQNVDISSLLDKPSPDMTWGYDHVIGHAVISGLELNHFWARNAPTTSMHPLGETTVQIAAHLRFLNLLTTSGPTMTWDRRSHDLDDNVQINVQICTLLIYGPDQLSLNQ